MNKNNLESDIVQNFISILNEAKESGNLQEFKQQVESTIKQIEEEENQSNELFENLSIFKDILAEDDIIVLRKPQESERDIFLSFAKQYSQTKYLYNSPEFCKITWERHISDRELNYSIIRKIDNQYIGYCGINNVNKKIWEIGIELGDDYCHKGYGYRALNLFLHKVSELSGKNEFSSKVRPQNIASQGLMEKLGFKPYGVTKFLLCDDSLAKIIEDADAHKIDDKLIALAKKFNTEPRKLLSHALEYRIRIEK